MSPFEKAGFLLLISLVPVSGVKALTADNAGQPYRGIVERNVFGLRAALPSKTENPTMPLVLRPKVTLTGIITILGKSLAFITVSGAGPGAPAESAMLAEGQTLDEIEVKSIDARAGIVRVLNHGESQTLDFDREGAKSPERPADRGPMTPTPRDPPVRTEAPLSPEEQVALIEIQRAKYQQENDQIGPILPPTEMSSEVSTGAPGQ